MAKRLVFCFDGTWNRLSADNPTNVVLLAQMVCPIDANGVPQLVYYDEGIGTGVYFAKKLWEGMFGKGMERILREAYLFLLFNHEPGDEIFIFGFSRGAFTARSFAGFIRHAGILDVASASKIDEALELYKAAPAGKTGQESDAAQEFRMQNCRSVCVSEEDRAYRLAEDPEFDPETPLLDIQYLGVWDTVAGLGVPEKVPFAKHFNTRYRFHNAVLTSKIKAARHAVAIDERRLTFPVTLFDREKIDELNSLASDTNSGPFDDWNAPYQQKWFPGVHGAVGGGGQSRGLSDAALHWVLSGARRQGLQLRSSKDSVVFEIIPDAFAPIFNDPPGHIKRAQDAVHSGLGIARAGPQKADEIAHWTFQRWHGAQQRDDLRYQPKALRHVEADLVDWPYTSPPQWKSGHAGADLVFDEIEVGGKTLSALALERLGDRSRWGELFELNRDRIDDPDYLPTGAVLRVPKLPDQAN